MIWTLVSLSRERKHVLLRSTTLDGIWQQIAVHAPIAKKIGRLREDMVLDQNPEYLPNATTDGRNIDSNQICKAGDWREIDRGDVNNVTAKSVGIERCRLNIPYICLLTLIYPKIELSE